MEIKHLGPICLEKPTSLQVIPLLNLSNFNRPLTAARLSATPGSVDFLGPKMGAHNEEIYCGELGLSKERLAELKAAAVI